MNPMQAPNTGVGRKLYTQSNCGDTRNSIQTPCYARCLVCKNNGDKRIATFHGIGNAWGGNDWSGDTGHSADSWCHDEVKWFVELDRLAVRTTNKEVSDIFLNNA